MKKVLIFIELIVIVLLIGLAVIVFVPGAKTGALKSFLGCSLGKSIVSCGIGKEYEENIQDSDYHEGAIHINEGLSLAEEYTNIALLGGDDSGENPEGFLGVGAHGDSMIVLSINNKTGQMKMLSVYRDTYLQYTVKDVNYGKATNALYFGGVNSVINMLNKNLDLNIKDYIIINYSGLAAIIDQLGGLSLTITEEEKEYANWQLEDTRIRTGITDPDIETYGEVELTGVQAVAFCRIRQTNFTDQEGNVFHDDFGRAERQKYVLKLTLEKIREAKIKELYSISKNIIKDNEEKELVLTSLTLEEALDILKISLDLNLSESAGFPQERGSKNMSGGLSVIPKTLETNVVELHKFLFDLDDYTPTDSVKEISDVIIEQTGIR